MILPDVASSGLPCVLFWCSTITSLVNLFMLKCHFLLSFYSHLEHYSLVSTSAVPGNKIKSWGPNSGPVFCFSSTTVGWTTAGWTAGPGSYPFADLDHGRKHTK